MREFTKYDFDSFGLGLSPVPRLVRSDSGQSFAVANSYMSQGFQKIFAKPIVSGQLFLPGRVTSRYRFGLDEINSLCEVVDSELSKLDPSLFLLASLDAKSCGYGKTRRTLSLHSVPTTLVPGLDKNIWKQFIGREREKPVCHRGYSDRTLRNSY